MYDALILGNLLRRGELSSYQNGRTITVRYRGMSACDVIEPNNERVTYRYLSDARTDLRRRGVDVDRGWF